MGKRSGFGIDAPEPMTANEVENLDFKRIDAFSDISPFVDPMYDAAFSLIEWFLKIKSDLSKNHELKALLQGKNFTGDFFMQYSLPSKKT